MGWMRGGSLMMRRSPSTMCVSLSSACMLSRVRALATWPRPACGHAGRSGLHLLEQSLGVEARVPDIQIGHPGELTHRRPVAPDDAQHTPLRSLTEYPLSRPAIAKLAASRFTSHSHGPGSVSSKSFMSNTSRRSGEREHTEVHEVRVAAQLRREPRAGRVGQVAGHDQRRAPIEGERRDQHPPVPDRHELRALASRPGSPAVPPGQAGCARREAGVARPRHLGPRGLAPSHPLRDGQVRDHLAVLVPHARRNGAGLVRQASSSTLPMREPSSRCRLIDSESPAGQRRPLGPSPARYGAAARWLSIRPRSRNRRRQSDRGDRVLDHDHRPGVVLVLLLLSDPWTMVGAAAALAIAVAAAWNAITRRRAARLVSAALAVIAVVVCIVVLLAAHDVLALCVSLGLAIAAVTLGRYSLSRATACP